jgi:hypothetical protein
MPRTKGNTGNNTGKEIPLEDFNFPEPVANIVQSARDLKKMHDDAASVWQDNAYRNLAINRADPIISETRNFLSTALTTMQFLEFLEKESQKRLSPTAGLGGWLSVFDIEMIAKRTTSRWFSGDGWGSTWK